MPNGSFAFQLLILGERIFFDHKSKGITKDSLDVGEQPWEVPGVNWRCCRCFKDFQSKVMSSHCWFEFVFSTKRWRYEWYLPAQQGREMNRVSCFKEGDSCFKGRRMYIYRSWLLATYHCRAPKISRLAASPKVMWIQNLYFSRSKTYLLGSIG